VFVDQLIDFRVKKFYSFTDFKYIYNSSDNDFLKYNSLINNIPKDILELVDERFLTGSRKKSLQDIIKTSYQPTKFLYNLQLSEIKNTNSNAENRWQNIFQNKELNWAKIYTLVFQTCTDTNLRCFQYKFIMRLTATNTYLFRCKLTSSNLCDLCNECDEDIEHLFWKCRVAQHLWNRLADYMHDKGILLYNVF